MKRHTAMAAAAFALLMALGMAQQTPLTVNPSRDGFTAHVLRWGTNGLSKDLMIYARRADGTEVWAQELATMKDEPLHKNPKHGMPGLDRRTIYYPNGSSRSILDTKEWVETLSISTTRLSGLRSPSNHCLADGWDFVGYDELKGVKLSHIRKERDTAGSIKGQDLAKNVDEYWYWEEANCMMLQYKSTYFNSNNEEVAVNWNELIRLDNGAPDERLFEVPKSYHEGSDHDLERLLLKERLGADYEKKAPQCFLDFINSPDIYSEQKKSLKSVIKALKPYGL